MRRAKKFSNSTEGSAGNPKFTWSSFFQVHAAYKIYKRTLESFRYKRPGDGSFFDARLPWYRLLKDLSICIEEERPLLPRAFENDAARVLGDVVSSNYKATADQLYSPLEAKLCSKA